MFGIWGFYGGSAVNNPPADAGDVGLIPGLRRFPGEGNGNALHYSCLGNPIDRGAWQAIVHGVVRVRHDLVTKQPPPPCSIYSKNKIIKAHSLKIIDIYSVISLENAKELYS